MAVNYSFIVKRLFQMDHLYAMLSGVTHHPFAVCTEDTFEDQLFLFAEKDLIDAKGKELADRKYQVRALDIPKTNNARRKFFVDAHYMGFTQVLFVDASGEQILPLKAIVDVEADLKKLPKNKRPMMNQALQMTSLYFVQEMSRPIPREQNPAIPDLMDELEHNLETAQLIAAGIAIPDPKDPKQSKVGLMNIQDKEGKKYIPVFSDALEFSSFPQPEKNKFRGFPTTLKHMRSSLDGEVNTLVLNPGSIQLRITKPLVDRILARAEEE